MRKVPAAKITSTGSFKPALIRSRTKSRALCGVPTGAVIVPELVSSPSVATWISIAQSNGDSAIEIDINHVERDILDRVIIRKAGIWRGFHTSSQLPIGQMHLAAFMNPVTKGWK